MDVMHEQQILNDYIHILQEHDINEVNDTLKKCDCKEYSAKSRHATCTRRQKICEEVYKSRLLANINPDMFLNQMNCDRIHHLDLAYLFIIMC